MVPGRKEGFPIDFRSIELERHNETQFRFQEEQSLKNVQVLTIRRSAKSRYLVAFLLILCQFAVVDTINFLPVGIILYAFGISLAVEQLVNPTLFLWEEEDNENLLRQRYDAEMKRAIDNAMFEYQILKGRNNVRIVPIQQGDKTILYVV